MKVRRPLFSSNFHEGTYGSVWTLSHLLSGVIGGFLLRFLGIPSFSAFVVLLLAAVAWEFFEIRSEIYETWQNRTVDVVAALVGFCAIFWGIPNIFARWSLVLFVVVTLVRIVLEVLGWPSYRESKKRFHAMHSEKKDKQK